MPSVDQQTFSCTGDSAAGPVSVQCGRHDAKLPCEASRVDGVETTPVLIRHWLAGCANTLNRSSRSDHTFISCMSCTYKQPLLFDHAMIRHAQRPACAPQHNAEATLAIPVDGVLDINGCFWLMYDCMQDWMSKHDGRQMYLASTVTHDALLPRIVCSCIEGSQ